MPTYDYVCDACSHELEIFQSIKEDPLTKCPKCGKKKLRRKIGVGGGLIFKGGGFYITDYRSDSYKEAAKQDQKNSGAAKPEAAEKPRNAEKPASDAKPESKPAPKTEKPKSDGKKAPRR